MFVVLILSVYESLRIMPSVLEAMSVEIKLRKSTNLYICFYKVLNYDYVVGDMKAADNIALPFSIFWRRMTF